MPNQKITELTADTAPTTDDLVVIVNDPSGTPVNKKVALIDMLNTLIGPQPPCARLTTESGVPVSSSDRTSQGTIYWTPYNGSRVWLYTSSKWTPYTLTEKSLALTITADKNYDVFAYDSSGTITLELSAAWGSDTSRTDALTTQNGMVVKSGATNKLWIGTIRASGSNVTADAAAARFVWNTFNKVLRHMAAATETQDTWNYTLATPRQANANTANQLAYVSGAADSAVQVDVLGLATSASKVNVAVGVGVDSTSVNSAQMYGQNTVPTAASSPAIRVPAKYVGSTLLGYHFLAWLEYSEASGTTAWYGDAGAPTFYQSGITGTIFN